MVQNYMKREITLNNYICDRYYMVSYNYFDSATTVRGILLNYSSGNVAVLAEDGIYHIKYQNIYHMQPIQMPPLDKFNERYQYILKVLQEDKEFYKDKLTVFSGETTNEEIRNNS